MDSPTRRSGRTLVMGFTSPDWPALLDAPRPGSRRWSARQAPTPHAPTPPSGRGRRPERPQDRLVGLRGHRQRRPHQLRASAASAACCSPIHASTRGGTCTATFTGAPCCCGLICHVPRLGKAGPTAGLLWVVASGVIPWGGDQADHLGFDLRNAGGRGPAARPRRSRPPTRRLSRAGQKTGAAPHRCRGRPAASRPTPRQGQPRPPRRGD